jgi:hypothetical protein
MLVLDAKVNDLPSNDHYENEMLKDVHELILSTCVVYWKTYLCKVVKLFDIVEVIAQVPSEGVAQ